MNIVVYYKKGSAFYSMPNMYYTPIGFIKEYGLKNILKLLFNDNIYISSNYVNDWLQGNYYAKLTNKKNKKFI